MRAASALARNFAVEVIGWLRPERRGRVLSKTFDPLPFKLHLVELWTAKHLPKNVLGYTGRYIEILVRMLRIGNSIKPHIIHAHEIDALLIGYFLKKITPGAKLIYDAHELYREQDTWRKNRLVVRMLSRLETYLMRRCDEIIACNRYRADIMYREYGAPFLPKVIRNLPPFSEPGERDDKLRDFVRQRNPGIDRIIINPGGLMYRGIELVLSAIAKVPPTIGLVVIGWEADNAGHKMEQLIRHYGVENRVFLYPQLPYVELIKYLRTADLGLVIYPKTNRNNYYCASNKIFEFAMSGLPVVAVNFPPCTDILEQYHYGICFTWNDPTALQQAITECLSSEQRYQQMRAEALRAAREENWDKERLRLLEIYKQVLSETSHKSHASENL
jgi:glycosyltransferase involved in cell wall biosynthesis